jgi:hypothetical protein
MSRRPRARAGSAHPAGHERPKAFAVRAPEGTLRVCLINQNITRDERVVIDLGRKFTLSAALADRPARDAWYISKTPFAELGHLLVENLTTDRIARW